MKKKVVPAKVPVALEFPDEMSSAIEEVLEGEYELGYFGEKLTILDIGANVGSFAIWANMRWPQSKIYAFEPHPETFIILSNNIEKLDNIICHNVAVYPSDKGQELFYSRYAGDGESGLVVSVDKMFEELHEEKTFVVPALHPKKLPKSDVIKIDTEGAEFQILSSMNLSEASLILLEYHYLEDRDNIKEMLKREFLLEREDNFEWSALLANSEYKRNLKDNYYGRLFFVNKRLNKLRRYTAADI